MKWLILGVETSFLARIGTLSGSMKVLSLKMNLFVIIQVYLKGWTVYFESEIVRILHGEEAYNVIALCKCENNAINSYCKNIG